ncbi:MAG: hypothetical protein AAFS10_26770, partial [Myxococcota bacterium]
MDVTESCWRCLCHLVEVVHAATAPVQGVGLRFGPEDDAPPLALLDALPDPQPNTWRLWVTVDDTAAPPALPEAVAHWY